MKFPEPVNLGYLLVHAPAGLSVAGRVSVDNRPAGFAGAVVLVSPLLTSGDKL